MSTVAKSKNQAPATIIYLEMLRNVYANTGDSAKSTQYGQQILAIYRDSKAKNLDIPVEALDLIAFGLIPRLEQKKNTLKDLKLEFPEQKFNQIVKQKLAGLDTLTVDVNEIQKTGSGKGIVKAYKHLINAYEEFAVELRDFTPPDKAPEYVESFKKAMSGVWTPILATAQKRREEVIALIEKNTILASENFEMLASQGATLAPEYRHAESMILMDRGGVR